MRTYSVGATARA